MLVTSSKFMSLSADEFGKLAINEIDSLARFAASLTSNPAEADDLVQETYLRALRARETFELRDHGLRPWLMRIMHNVFLTRTARAKRQPMPTDPEELAAQSPPDESFPVLPAEMDGTIKQALDELSEDLRSALMLWAVEDLSYKEIASVLDVPIGTVMSRLHRARHALARKLKETAPEMAWTTAKYG